MKQLWRTAVLSTLPVLAGYLVLGLGFGLLATEAGISPLLAVLMSLLIYAGSMQYAAVGLLTGGASLVTVAFTTLAVNARHLFYGVSMLDQYRDTGALKPYLVLSLTDETYSLISSTLPPAARANPNRYCLLVSLLNHAYWVGGTALGVLVGGVLPLNTEGIEFALTALFLTVFVEGWLSTKRHLPAVVGLLASVTSLLVLGADAFLIPAMLLIALSLSFVKEDAAHE